MLSHRHNQSKEVYPSIALWVICNKITTEDESGLVGCLFACLTSQQHASVSQGRICTDNFTCCHTEIEAADQTFYHTQSQYTDTGPTSPSADPITQVPGRIATGVPIFESLVCLDPEKIPSQTGFEPGIFRSRGGRLTTRPTRRSWIKDADFPLFSRFFPLFLARSALRRSVSRFLYFLQFHLSLSELSVSFCVHFLWDGTHT